MRGKRKGAPTIGNKVWIGPNATIVGKINVGNERKTTLYMNLQSIDNKSIICEGKNNEHNITYHGCRYR